MMTTRAHLVAASVLAAHSVACNAQSYTILHAFRGGKDGAYPSPGSGAGFVGDAAGNLYGVTAGQDVATDFGTIFEVSPPASGKSAWTEAVLYRFKGGSDGDYPAATLLPDGAGGFFGNTAEGGTGSCAPVGMPAGCGTAFQLTPPGPGKSAWKESVLYRFQSGADGASPQGNFVRGASGSLYGMTTSGGGGNCPYSGGGCGTVFRLDPPAPGSKSWTETVLYAFSGGADGAEPAAGLTADEAGNLYGETGFGGNLDCGGGSGCGVIFELSPPGPGQTVWTQTVLYAFQGGSDGANPQAPPIFGNKGVLLGTTANGGSTACSSGCGTVYELTPPKKSGSAWGFKVLYALQGPPDGAYLNSALVPDGNGHYVTGTVYGGTGSCTSGSSPAGCGAVVMLAPPARRGGAWAESVLYSLPTASYGEYILGQLSVDSAGVISGAAAGGNPKYCGGYGCGVAFSLVP